MKSGQATSSAEDGLPTFLPTVSDGLVAWVYLIIAGIFEWGWPVGLKLGWSEQVAHYGWIVFAIVCMAASGTLLLIAQRTIPMGTAYAVWTGIGAVGTFVLGITIFSEAANVARFFSSG